MVGALVHGEELQGAQEPVVRFYLRHSVLNRIRDEIRRSAIGETESAEGCGQRVDSGSSSDAQIQVREERLLFRRALNRLTPEDQAVIVGRVELRLGCAELAAALGAPSAEAVRVASHRALSRLGREVGLLEARRAKVAASARLRARKGQVSPPS